MDSCQAEVSLMQFSYLDLQKKEKDLRKKNNIYFAFVDLERAFNSVTHRILWWAMPKLRINELVIQNVKCMYGNAHSKVGITNSYTNPINVSVGVHEGFVLRPFPLIIVMKALSHDFRTGCPC